MRPNLPLMRATLTGALGGLLFGFDTVVIAGAIDALVRLYGLSPQNKGLTVAIGLIGTVIGALGAGQVGQKLGSRETLRITAVLYVISAAGCGLAWSWPAFMVFRFIGGLGIGASSVLGPVYIAELAPAKWRGRLVAAFQFNVVFGIMVAYTSNYFIRTMHLGAAEWRWQVGVAGVPAVAFLLLLFGIPRSPRWSASQQPHRRGAGGAQADGRSRSRGRAGRYPRRAPTGARLGARAGVPLEVPLSALSGHLHRRLQPTGGHQRDSLLPEQHFCGGGLQPDFERPAGDRDRGHEFSVHHRGDVADRQAGTQDAAADRRGGLLELPGRCGVAVRQPSRTPARCCGCW